MPYSHSFFQGLSSSRYEDFLLKILFVLHVNFLVKVYGQFLLVMEHLEGVFCLIVQFIVDQ